MLTASEESEKQLVTKVTDLNQQFRDQTQALAVATSTQQQLQKEVEKEKEGNQVLSARIIELSQKLEERESEARTIPRDFSFASSEFQASLTCGLYLSFCYLSLCCPIGCEWRCVTG